MKVGVDGFCYHRWFGQAYPGLEAVPDTAMSVLDVVDRAAALGADGLAVESFMLPDGPGAADRLAGPLGERARAAGLDLLWAWGHPDGLGSGARPEALADLRRHADLAAANGVRVMRICAGGRRTRPAGWTEHRRALLPLLATAGEIARHRGLVLAVENHADLLADELVELITVLDDPAVRVCLDTGNNLRMLEDPARAIEVLAPYAAAVHLKDVQAYRGDPRTFTFWPSVPVGRGLIDVPRALRALADAGFAGLLAIEIDYLRPDLGLDEDAALAESIAFTRRALAGLARSG